MKRWIPLLALALACPDPRGDHAPPRPAGKPEFDLPAIAGGRLVTLWNWGLHVPDQTSALVVTDAGGSRELRIEQPTDAVWISPDALFVRAGAPPPRRVQGVLQLVPAEAFEAWPRSDAEGFPVLAPDLLPGRRVAAVEISGRDGAPDSIEIRSFELHARVLARADAEASESPSAFSPDGARLAVSYSTRILSHPHQLHFFRIGLRPRDLSSLTRLRDALGDAEEPPAGSLLLWWDRSGIWAHVDGWVARCDPDAGGCTPVWRPPAPWHPNRGVPLGPDSALVGVSHEERYGSPEVRNRQLWRLDLENGEAEKIYETPERVYLAGFDWIADPREPAAAAEPMP